MSREEYEKEERMKAEIEAEAARKKSANNGRRAAKLEELLLGAGTTDDQNNHRGELDQGIKEIRHIVSHPLLFSFNSAASAASAPSAVAMELSPTASILEYSQLQKPVGWEDVFQTKYAELERISMLVAENEIKYQTASFPLRKDIFRAFHLTPLDKVRVVLIGQDPYPGVVNGRPAAQGLSFSCSRDDRVEKSLLNIFKELERSFRPNFKMPSHGDLTSWASQGVLLLNTALTFQPGIQSGSAEQKAYWNVWLPFIQYILNVLAERRPKTAYILLGAHAQKFEQYINDKAFKSKASHPSPQNVGNTRDPFIGSNVFLRVNQYLESISEPGIVWNI